MASVVVSEVLMGITVVEFLRILGMEKGLLFPFKHARVDVSDLFCSVMVNRPKTKSLRHCVSQQTIYSKSYLKRCDCTLGMSIVTNFGKIERAYHLPFQDCIPTAHRPFKKCVFLFNLWQWPFKKVCPF